MKKHTRSRRVKTTITNPASESSSAQSSSTSATHGTIRTSAFTVTSIKRSNELRVEGEQARSKRSKGLMSQVMATRAAASALVVESGAQADDDTPACYQDPYNVDFDSDWDDIDEPPVISHAGGEGDLTSEAYRYICTPGYTYKHARGILQERRARLEASNRNWENQMPRLVTGYLEWKAALLHEDLDREMDIEFPVFEVTAIETFNRVRYFPIPQKPNEEPNVSLIRLGMLGCSPSDPSVAISLDTLELYHRLRRRNGQLSIQAMARTLCDLHNHTYLPYFRDQFSIAFDVYLDILRRVKHQADVALGRDTPNWRALNACPPCSYELDGEEPLIPRALHVVDGNYSMKRAANAGLVDQRDFKSDYLISREEVNRFQFEVKGRRPKEREKETEEKSDDDEEDEPSIEGDAPWVGLDLPGDAADGQEKLTSCTKNWKAAEEKISALAIYEINGGFPMACRHGFIEVFVEIVQSGELAKYPLAASNFLLTVFGDNQGLGFDIGCSFGETLKNSPMLGETAKRKGLQMIVNAFHGWAHNRLCQLKYHPLYRAGLGLEDLETLERFFSSSNTIARTIRHATSFHWHQAMDLHFRQWVDQKYQELSNFLLNNYKQALKIISDYKPELQAFKERLQIDDQVIDGWLGEEEIFLQNLKEEPEERVLACSYVEALGLRRKTDELWQAISEDILNPPADLVNDYNASVRWTSRVEASRRSAMEQANIAIRTVADLETRLMLKHPWVEDTPEYQDTVKYMQQRTFHRTLNKLEQLVVQRLFELSKANVVGMGYKLRESVWRALKTRGKAIRTALKKYNAIAPRMSPPAPLLHWKQLMEYSFISEFDLLKHAHSHSDITTKPWALPLNREMATKHHKMKRAYEEMNRVNYESRRLRTSIRDEHKNYEHHTRRVAELDPNLASELQRMYDVRRRENNTHSTRLDILEALPGFTGMRGPGKRKDTSGGDIGEGSSQGALAAQGESEDDIWRQGILGGNSAGGVQQDEPDDELSEGLLDVTERFSMDLRLVSGIPESMLYEFAV